MRQTSVGSAGRLEIVLPGPLPEDLAARIGVRIVSLRRRRGWSRVELARRLGVRRDRLAKWELGKSIPPVEMLVALRNALGVSLDELITGEPTTIQGRLTVQQYEDLGLLLEAIQKVLHGPAWVSLPGDNAQSGRP